MMANGDVAQPPVLNRHWYMEPFFELFFGVEVQNVSYPVCDGSMGGIPQSEDGCNRQLDKGWLN